MVNNMIPINSFVVKIARDCNLNCSYCYEYNMGDDSWKEQEKYMSLEVLRRLISRIEEHCKEYKINQLEIMMHGGEPTIVGKKRMIEYLNEFRNNKLISQATIGIQTNGYSLDNEWIKIFENYNIFVGVSLDGIPTDNDRNRYLLNGKGTGSKVEKGLNILMNSVCFSGILAVIDIKNDPISTFRYLKGFNPPLLDFLLPHGHWDKRPYGKEKEESQCYADWLISIFEEWYFNKSDICVRIFEEIIEHLLGGKGSLETLGLEPISLLTISTSGDYEAVDTMKSVYPDAHKLGINVNNAAISEVFNKTQVLERIIGKNALCNDCLTCEFLKTCGGGYYPHRYSIENKFKNRSIYCADLKKIFEIIDSTIKIDLERFNRLQKTF